MVSRNQGIRESSHHGIVKNHRIRPRNNNKKTRMETSATQITSSSWTGRRAHPDFDTSTCAKRRLAPTIQRLLLQRVTLIARGHRRRNPRTHEKAQITSFDRESSEATASAGTCTSSGSAHALARTPSRLNATSRHRLYMNDFFVAEKRTHTHANKT